MQMALSYRLLQMGWNRWRCERTVWLLRWNYIARLRWRLLIGIVWRRRCGLCILRDRNRLWILSGWHRIQHNILSGATLNALRRCAIGLLRWRWLRLGADRTVIQWSRYAHSVRYRRCNIKHKSIKHSILHSGYRSRYAFSRESLMLHHTEH